MDKTIQQLAKTQANDHAEFLGEFTKYIYRHAHYHGFKHGYDYATEHNTSEYIKSCRTLAKHMSYTEPEEE
jgi:hypothetical protein